MDRGLSIKFVKQISPILLMFGWMEQVSAQPKLANTYVVVTDRTSSSVIRYEPTNGQLKDVFFRDVGASPEAVVFGPDQNVYVTTALGGSGRVRRYNGATGELIDDFVSAGSSPLRIPEGLTFGPDGDLYVVDVAQHAVLRYEGVTGRYLGTFIAERAGGLENPAGIVFGPDGNIYVTSGIPLSSGSPATLSPQIIRFDGRTGAFKDVFVQTRSGGLDSPFSLTFGPDGNLYVSSVLGNSILRYNGQTGAFIDAFVRPGAGGLTRPTGLQFGPDGHFYVASSFSPTIAILRYNGQTGAFMDVFASRGTGGLSGPTGVLFYSFDSEIAPDGGEPAVVAREEGDRLVVWASGSSVKGRLFDSRGVDRRGVITVASTAAPARHPQAVATASGFVVIWQSPASGGSSVNRMYSLSLDTLAAPVGTAQTISLPPSGSGDVDDSGGAIAGIGSDKVAVAWTRRDSRGTFVMSRVMTDRGNFVGPEVALSSGGQEDQVAIASSGPGRLIAAWRKRSSSGGREIVAAPFTTEYLSDGPAVTLDSGQSGDVNAVKLGSDGGGRVTAVWTSTPRTTPSAGATAASERVYAAPLSSSAAPVIAPFAVNLDSNRAAGSPTLTSGRAGVGIFWEYSSSAGRKAIYGRMLDSSGRLAKHEFIVNEGVFANEVFAQPSAAMSADGTITIAAERTLAGNARGIATRTRTESAEASRSRRRAVKR